MRFCAGIAVAFILVGAVLASDVEPMRDVEPIQMEEGTPRAQLEEQMKSLISSGNRMMRHWEAQDAEEESRAEPPPVLEEEEEEEDNMVPADAADIPDPRGSPQHVEKEYDEIFHHNTPAPGHKFQYHPSPEAQGEVETTADMDNEGPPDQKQTPLSHKKKAKKAKKAKKPERVPMSRKALKEKKADQIADGLEAAAALLGKKAVDRTVGPHVDKKALKMLGKMKYARRYPKSWTKKAPKLTRAQRKKKEHQEISWAKKTLHMDSHETDEQAAEGEAPDKQAETWLGLRAPAKPPAPKQKKVAGLPRSEQPETLVMRTARHFDDEEDASDPRGESLEQQSPQMIEAEKEEARHAAAPKRHQARTPSHRIGFSAAHRAELREMREAMAQDKHLRQQARRARAADPRGGRHHARVAPPSNGKLLASPHLPTAEEEAAESKEEEEKRKAFTAQFLAAKRTAQEMNKKNMPAKKTVHAKPAKPESKEAYRRRLHNRVVNNPVFKHAKQYGLLKKKKKHAALHSQSHAMKHTSLLSMAGMSGGVRKGGFTHVALDFGLSD